MRRNLDRLQGLILAERLMLALAPKMGRNEAHHAVEALSQRAIAEKRQLHDIALADARIGEHLAPAEIDALFDPSGYLGSSDEFIDAALAAHEKAQQARGAPLGEP
jgi:3-carboxy-cis,cis-muconate cycloisomerase